MNNELFKDQKIPLLYIKLSLPLVFSMVITLIYNLADTFFVAQTNNTNLVAGVSLGAPLFTFLMALGNVFGQGGCSLISRLMGQKEADAVRRVSAFCLYGALLCGVVIAVVLLLFRSPILQVLGTSADTLSYASQYYTWLSIGSPVVVASFIHSNLLRSEGMSKESMIGTVGGAVVNIVLDPILISVVGLGAAGAAIATIIGYAFSVVFFAWIVHRKSQNLSLNIRECRISKTFLRQIFGIGIPAALSNVMQSAAVIMMNQFLLPFGNEKIAAMGIVLKVNMIALLILVGLTFGGQPLYGYYYGAGDRKKLKELFQFCLRFIGIVSLLLSVVIFLAAPIFLNIFMDNSQIVADGTIMLRLQVITMVVVGFVLLITILCQSIGEVVGSFILSISRQGIVFLVVLMVSYWLFGYYGILISQAVSDIITAVIAFVLLMRIRKRLF